MNSNINFLVDVLLNPGLPLADRDDAAMDLGKFDDPQALDALIAIAAREGEHSMIAASCGESIAEIWKRTGKYDAGVVARLTPAAKSEVTAILG